jgi:pimeloyl-ACP methyl ester carboxylesterase
MSKKYEEYYIDTEDGLKIAIKHWGDKNSSKRIVCVHGFMDNSSSFDYLAPLLVTEGYQCVCYDLEGHGRSSHFNKSSDYLFLIRIRTIYQIILQLDWTSFTLMGHSLGILVC